MQLNWDSTVAGCNEDVPQKQLRQVYIALLRNSDKLKHDIAHYDRLPESDPDKSYNWLHERVEALMYRERLQRNRNQQTAAHSGKGPGAPGAGKPTKGDPKKGKPKGGGQGGNGDDGGKSAKGGKGKDGKKGKPKKGGDGSSWRSSSPSSSGSEHPGDKTRICRYWKKGTCKFGDSCKFRHAYDENEKPPAGAADDANNQPSAKAKAKAKAEAAKKTEGAGGVAVQIEPIS